MTIQRQYSLPNCKLILQGLSNDVADLGGRPLLAMVTNVECYLAGQKTPLIGGRDFLDSLIVTVGDYAQGYLSGIQHLIRRDRRQQNGLVQIQPVAHNLHRLIAQPEGNASDTPTEIDLTTVQLFDLVEALDQLFADPQTLPELSLELHPLSKRYVVSQEPIAKRATPVAIGLSSLVAAAALLFMLPIPEARRPETASSDPTTEQPSPSTSPATPVAAGAASPNASPSPNASSTPSPTSSGSEAAEVRGAGLNLTNAPEITDPTELDQLTVDLYDKLDLAWKKTPTFDGELIYRVGVNSGGDIVGYKYGNDAALTYLSDTPLADVQFSAPESAGNGSSASPSASPSTETTDPSTAATAKEPVAQFRVVFKSDGVLEVSPWDGLPGDATEASPSSEPSP